MMANVVDSEVKAVPAGQVPVVVETEVSSLVNVVSYAAIVITIGLFSSGL